jgi:putative ABC transport system permease protein
MATATAKGLGLTPTPDYVLISSPGGISRATQAALEDALRMEVPDARVYVERGYERDDGLMLAILFGVVGLVILVATLIATALGQAEAQPLLGTLAAVGATRRTRRALAAAQATYLGLLGAIVGVLVGLVPGTAISRLITADYGDDGRADFTHAITAIPWLQVSLPIVLVPLVAGALAWGSIRRAPTVTRRAT